VTRGNEHDAHGVLDLDRDAAAAFLRALTGPDETPVTFQTFADGDGESSVAPTVIHAPLADAWERLEDAQEHGHGIFVMVNEGDGQGRSSANVRGLRALFADADGAPVPLERLATPSMVVRSGHGEHYYWLLRPGERLDAFTPAQKGIAARLGTDPKVCDLARVLRLPGTYNLKDRSNPRRVELALCHADRRYTIAHVLAGLGATPADAPQPPAPPVARVLSGFAVDNARAYVREIVAIQGQEGDTDTFRAAATLLHDFDLPPATAWELLKEWNHTNASPPWPEMKLGEKFRNAQRYGKAPVGSKLAITLPASNEPMAEVEPSARVRLIASRWSPLTVALLEEPPPAKEFIWENAISVGDVGTFVGPGAAGKSATLVGLAVHMALGRPFLGRATRQAQAVIVSMEDNFDDYRRKLAAWRDALGSAWNSQRVAENVFPLDLRGTDVRLVTPKGRDYVPSFDAQALASIVKDGAPRVGLIVVETASRCGGDESNPAMSALISAAEKLSSLTGSAVVLVAHVSKEAARAGNGDQHAARGGGAIGDNGRFSITATLANKDKIAMKLAKGVDPATLERLVFLRVEKINCAPRNVIGLIERRPSKYQTITVAPFTAAAARDEDVRSRRGAALRDLVTLLADDGDVTPTRLAEDYRNEMKNIGIRSREIRGAVANAVEDGFLSEEPRKGQGGGTRLVAGENRVPRPESGSAGAVLVPANEPISKRASRSSVGGEA
jgi:hypothetical protein